MAVGEEYKDRSFIKTLSIVLISFISLPLIIMMAMYFTNETFQDNANNILSGLPGKTGTYFQLLPTKKEKEKTKDDIAKYYINFDEDRIVDKLLIVKREDDELFKYLLDSMGKEDPIKMKKVNEKLKTLKFNEKDPIKRILNEMNINNEEKINNLQKYYTSLDLPKSIYEIERTYASNEITTDELVDLFEKLKPDQAAKYLFYLDMDLKRKIEFRLPKEALREIEKKSEELLNQQEKTLELVSIYENKAVEDAVAELGDFTKYNSEELAIIFKGLTLNKSSRILSKIDYEDDDNKEFISNLFTEINYLEALQKNKLDTSSTIMKGVAIYKDYDEKIKELATIYQKTNIEDLTKMIETMLRRNQVYERHTLNEFEDIIFTEEQLVIDVLNKLKTNTVAEILENLKESDRILLSKKLLQ